MLDVHRTACRDQYDALNVHCLLVDWQLPVRSFLCNWTRGKEMGDIRRPPWYEISCHSLMGEIRLIHYMFHAHPTPINKADGVVRKNTNQIAQPLA